MSDDAGLAFFRITLLGMGDSGKTALTNVFVNNFCPLVYKETDDPELYYKKIKVEGNEDEGPFSVLVEIEDTYSSYRGDGESFGVPRNPNVFMDMSRSEDMYKFDKHAAKLTPEERSPFSAYGPPEVDIYRPLTKGRMGILIVFDVNSVDSYKEALNLHKLLLDSLDDQRTSIKPIVYLVGNKIDKNPTAEQTQQIIEAAREFSKETMIRFWEVSATDATNVKEMFLDMVDSIRANQVLWMLDEGGNGPLITAEEGQTQCSLQ